MPTQIVPITLQPGAQFIGDDGPWCNFVLEAGNPVQRFNLLPASQVQLTYLVDSTGCTSSDTSNCTTARGGLYDFSKSSTWVRTGNFTLQAGGDLVSGNDLIGTFGVDTISLPGVGGAQAISINNQVVASLTTKKFFNGLIGVNAAPVKFPSPTPSALSFLTNLKNQNLIPSTSFSYTAGGYNKGKSGVNGSLVLGGYDSSRFTPNNVALTFAQSDARQLVASVRTITYTDANTKSASSLLSTGGILALVDSTVPYMWLPQSACTLFENAFGIQWDSIRNIYTVNSTQHDNLLKSNPTVLFEISNSLTQGASVNISLPYSAFDLIATTPIVNNGSYLWPLQRANDASQYTLGRAFLQEAMLIVNYDKSNFSISQAVYDSNTPSHIVPILGEQSSGSASSQSSSSSSAAASGGGKSGGISGGAIGGIVVAVVVIALLAGAAFFCLRKRRKNKSQHQEGGQLQAPPPGYTEAKDDGRTSSEVANDQAFNDGPKFFHTALEHDTSTSQQHPDLAGHAELPGQPNRFSTHELPGHSDDMRRELDPGAHSTAPSPLVASPTLNPALLRSELSTPEPVGNEMAAGNLGNLPWHRDNNRHEMSSVPASPGAQSTDSEAISHAEGLQTALPPNMSPGQDYGFHPVENRRPAFNRGGSSDHGSIPMSPVSQMSDLDLGHVHGRKPSDPTVDSGVTHTSEEHTATTSNTTTDHPKHLSDIAEGKQKI